MLDISNSRFAFLDLETTGLSPWFGDRICEVGILLTEGKRVKYSFEQLVNPERPLSPAAASTNRLSAAELANAPFFGSVIRQIEALLKDSIVVCHNAYVDKNGERSTRHISPLQVVGLSDYLYLRAYCHLRHEERTFRLDRIIALQPA
jgi:DNA polymerase III epsilon subunit-like protein